MPLALRAVVVSDVVTLPDQRLDARILLATVGHQSTVIPLRLVMPEISADAYDDSTDAGMRRAAAVETAHEMVREMATGRLQYEVFGPQLQALGAPQALTTISLNDAKRDALSALLSTDAGLESLSRLQALTRNDTLAGYLAFLKSIRVTAVEL